MKTLIKRSFFILCALLGMTTLRAQSVDDIVGKYIDAIGGRTVLASINSLVINSNINVMGNDAPTTTYILAGKGFRSEMDFNGTKMIPWLGAVPLKPKPITEKAPKTSGSLSTMRSAWSARRVV